MIHPAVHPPRLLRSPALAAAFICLAAFAAIAILSASIFEYVPHSEDEVAYLFQAKVFAQGRLAVPTPAQRLVFWTPFVVDYQGQRFGKYSPGWPLLLGLGVRLDAPWLVNAGLAVLTLALVARLGRDMYGSRPGLWAAGLGLVTPGFLFLSSSLLSHAASLFWSTLALAALFYLVQGAPKNRRPYYALLAGLALGAAFTTRPFAGLGIGLPMGLFLLVLSFRGEVRWSLWPWLLLGGVMTAGLLPLYWWAVTGDPGFNPYLLVWPYDRVGFGPDVGPYGYDLPTVILSTRLKLNALATGLFGWPGWTNLLFLPIPFLARRPGRWDWLLAGTLAGLVGVHLFYWALGGIDGGFPRYYYDALPALLLLTGRGIQLSGEYLAHWRVGASGHSPLPKIWNRPRWRPEIKPGLGRLPQALVMLFILYSFIWTLPPLLAAQKGKYEITAAPLRVVAAARLAEPALVFVKGADRWNDFAAPFAANSPTLDGPVVYAPDRGPALNRAVRQQFQERTCWELAGGHLSRCRWR